MKTLLLPFSILDIITTGHAQALLRETIFTTMSRMGEVNIHCGNLADGMFFYEIHTGKELIGKGKFVIE
ncbi:MAG: hypothetical protein ABI763_03640 [Bacteroidota bacterium]